MARTYIVLPPEPDPGGEKLDAWGYVGAGAEAVNAESAVLVDTAGRPLSEDRTASGVLTADDDAVTIDTTGMQTVIIAVDDPDDDFFPTARPEVSHDGATFATVQVRRLNNGDLVTDVGNGTAIYVATVAGFAAFRVRIASASGSATVALRASAGLWSPARPVVAVDSGVAVTNWPTEQAVVAFSALPVANEMGGALAVTGAGGVPLAVADGGGSLTVDGPLTDAELRAAPVEVTAPGGDQPRRRGARAGCQCGDDCGGAGGCASLGSRRAGHAQHPRRNAGRCVGPVADHPRPEGRERLDLGRPRLQPERHPRHR
jgi:hypothetical protein